jgi:type VII secretion-associated protein (TIGR03931 family)
VTDVVVEVGPCAIRGPNDAPPEWGSAALDCIDDDVALLDDRAVSVQDLWADVIRTVAGDAVDTVVVVCPSWWSSSRVGRVRTAALMVAAKVVLQRRMQIIRDGVAARLATIVEVAPELVVVSHPGVRAAVLPLNGAAGDAEAVVAAVGTCARVLMDIPVGCELSGSGIAERLRAGGIAVTFADDVLHAADALLTRQDDQSADIAGRAPMLLRDRRWVAVFVGVLSAVVLCAGFSARNGAPVTPTDELAMTLLVEGRVGVMVPAAWTAQRITAGPGSARVQIVSPDDDSVVLHVTQSTGLPHSSLAMTARSLRAALDTEPDGIFVDFSSSGHRAGKAAVTYRELRPDHHVEWAVQIDGTLRIAIGCQSSPGREHLVREACDRAIRSAHAVS